MPPGEDEGRLSRRVMGAHLRRTPSSFGTTLTVLAVIFVLFYAFVLRTSPSVTGPALSSASGDFVYTEVQRHDGRAVTSTTRGTFVIAGDGDALVEGVAESDDPSLAQAGETRWAYDAGTRTALRAVVTAGARPEAAVTVDEWPPLWRVAAPTPLAYQSDAAIVRSAVEDDDRSIGIKPVLYQEREAWRASWRAGRWQKDLVVDQESGLVLWYSLVDVEDGGLGDEIEYRVDGLRLNATVEEAFDASPPAGAAVERRESRDPRIAPPRELAEGRLGAELPDYTLDPDGYVLVSAATTAARDVPASWADPPADAPGELDAPAGAPGEAAGPRDDDTLLLCYSRGLSSYTIEIVASGDRVTAAALRWEDLLGHQAVELQYGLFAGRQAHTWYGEGPTAVVWDDDYAVRVSGGLTRTEAVSILEGLEL
jgi:outer membrane lipoprotein-sorting protein